MQIRLLSYGYFGGGKYFSVGKDKVSVVGNACGDGFIGFATADNGYFFIQKSQMRTVFFYRIRLVQVIDKRRYKSIDIRLNARQFVNRPAIAA